MQRHLTLFVRLVYIRLLPLGLLLVVFAGDGDLERLELTLLSGLVEPKAAAECLGDETEETASQEHCGGTRYTSTL